MISEEGFIAGLELNSLNQIRRGIDTYRFEGIGDDCAIIPVENGYVLALTTDLVVEGVHFLFETTTPETVAQKALHVNLSDVAAMGVRPIATLLSIALPKKASKSDWADRFSKAWAQASERANVTLIGGDTTASTDKVVINVTAIGRGHKSHIKRRNAAQVGDIVCVARPLGRSKAGLRDILNGNYDSEAAHYHNAPEAQVLQGIWLGGREEVHAMMDISDGLATDLGRLVRASSLKQDTELSADVNLEMIPVARDATLEDAITGGEEYTLLFTVREEAVASLCEEYQRLFGSPLYPIGQITESLCEEVRWFDNGDQIEPDWECFTHF